MNKDALAKHDIYHKLSGFSGQDLHAIAKFVDFMRHQKNLEATKMLKMGGILSGYDIDFSDLSKLREETWQHVDEEALNG